MFFALPSAPIPKPSGNGCKGLVFRPCEAINWCSTVASHRVSSVPEELRQLVEASRLFQRSRRELIRRTLADPDGVVPNLVAIADSDLGDIGNHILRVLQICRQSGLAADRLYSLISPRTIHLAPLLADLGRAILVKARRLPVRKPVEEARLLMALAIHFRECGDTDGAIKASESAARIFRRIGGINGSTCADWVVAECLLSKHLLDAGRPGAALKVAKRAIEVARQVLGPRQSLSHGHALLAEGSCLIATRLWKEAAMILRDARRVWVKIAKRHPGHQPELAHAEMFLASAERGSGQLVEAEAFARSSYSTLTKLTVDGRGQHLEDFLTSVEILIAILAQQSDHRQVRQLIVEATGVLSELARSEPARYGHRLLWALLFWTRQQVRLGDEVTAMKLARTAVRQLSRLERLGIAMDPECGAAICGNLADGLLRRGQTNEAKHMLTRAIQWLRRFPKSHLRRDPMRDWLRRLGERVRIQSNL